MAVLALKCLADLVAAATSRECQRFVLGPHSVLSVLQIAVLSPDPGVIDAAVRLMSYLYEFGDFVTRQAIDDGPVFDTLLGVLSRPIATATTTTEPTTATITPLLLLHLLSTHLAVHVPRRLRLRYGHALDTLRYSADHAVQTYARRCLHVLGSAGLRAGIAVMYAEALVAKRAKLIEMVCDGCGCFYLSSRII